MSSKTVEQEQHGLKRAFMLTIPASDIEARLDQEVKRLAPQVRMPGFRPGKVPPNLIKKMHGEALQQDALNNAVQAGVEQLLNEKGVRPALRPEVSLDNYEPGKDAEVKVVVEALPVVSEPNYANLKLDRLTVAPESAAIDEQVEAIAKGNKSWSDAPKKHQAAMGELVVIDYVGSIDGTPFEGGTGEGMSVELGSGRLIPGFEEQLVGVRSGDERTVTLTFPADYPAEKLRGKDAQFQVTVKAVKTGSEAKADDAFAKSLGLESLDHLRDLVRSQMEQQLNELTRTHMKRQLLDQLAARHDFEVPEGMVEAEYTNILNQLRHEASHESDPEAAMAEIERDAAEYRRISERRVRLGLLLSEIGAINGIEVTDQEMNMIVANAAAQYQGKDRDNFIKFVQSDATAQAQLRAPLYEDKVVDFLFTEADITDREATRAELEADLEAEEGHVHGPGCGHDHSAPTSGTAKTAKAKPGKEAAKKRATSPQSKPAKAAAAAKKADTKPVPATSAVKTAASKESKEKAAIKPAKAAAKSSAKTAKPAAAATAPAKKGAKKIK